VHYGNLLPPTLEQLTLLGESGSYTRAKNRVDLQDQFAELLLRKESHFPSLRKLTIEMVDVAGRETVQEACQSRGVELVWRG
jgi:hypothetical protein